MAVLSIRCRHPQAGSLCTAISNDAWKQKNLSFISRPLFRRLTSEKKCRTSKFPKLVRKPLRYRPDARKGRSRRISGRRLYSAPPSRRGGHADQTKCHATLETAWPGRSDVCPPQLRPVEGSVSFVCRAHLPLPEGGAKTRPRRKPRTTYSTSD